MNILANGAVSKLADVIDVYYDDPAVKIASRDDLAGKTPMGTLTEVLAGMSTTASGELAAGASDTITIAFKMRESANNDYMNLSIGSDFSVQVVAMQLTAEEDSFDDQYDVEATYLNQDADGAWLINNMDELYYFASQVNGGTSYKGETVKLMADIDLKGYNWIPIADTNQGFAGTFDGQDHTISNLNVKGATSAGFFTSAASTAVIKNVTFDKANVSGTHYVAVVLAGEWNENAKATIESCHVTNSTVTCDTDASNDNGDKVGGICGYAVSINIKDCSVKNTTIKAYRDFGGILGCSNAAHNSITGNSVDNLTLIIDTDVNYNNYGTVEKHNAGAIVGRVNSGTVDGNTTGKVTVVYEKQIHTADDLVNAFANMKSGDVLSIAKDIDMSGKTLAAVTGNKAFTLRGNGHTISNLNSTQQALFVSHSGSSAYTFEDVVLENCSVVSATNYGGLFVGNGDTSDAITIKNCVVKNCTVKSAKYAAAFIGYTAGWNKVGDGPVYSDVLVENCSVIGGSITGGGSVGAAIAHAGGNPDTTSTVTGLKVDGVAINGEDAAHTGIVVGTANIGKTVINGTVYANVTGNYNTATVLYGRFVPGTTGTLTIDGVNK